MARHSFLSREDRVLNETARARSRDFLASKLQMFWHDENKHGSSAFSFRLNSFPLTLCTKEL